MPVGFSTLLFLLGTTGAVVSYIYIHKRKKSSTKSPAVMAAEMISCLLAAVSACYLVIALLLLGGID